MKNRARVLIVDDDIGMRETLSDILTDLGHHVEIADDGYKAIEKINAKSFDVVLMDIKMPGINGVETYKKIKSIRPEAVVMMMTAYSVEDLITEALEEGAYGVMHKPVDINKVVEFIKHVKESALIMIVDDNPSNCETLIDILAEKGYRITRASSGKEAITKVQERSFDIVFIDVKMPVMNGLEAYLALRKIRPDIKVIMMTAYHQEVQDLVEEAIRNHAYTCIYKPFDVDKLLGIVEGILAKKTKNEIQHIEVTQ